MRFRRCVNVAWTALPVEGIDAVCDATGLTVLPPEGIDTVFIDPVFIALPVEGIDANVGRVCSMLSAPRLLATRKIFNVQ